MEERCCAHGCSSSTRSSPLRLFHTMTEVRARLTEWLIVLGRQDILEELNIKNRGESLIICEKHFPDLEKASPTRSYVRGSSKVTKNADTQTDVVPPTLMITPVEIVDIPPKQETHTVPSVNIPTIIPAQQNVNGIPLSGFLNNITPEQQHISNNTIPGFKGNVDPVQTIEVAPGPVIGQKSVPRILPRILPKPNNVRLNFNVNTPYFIDLNSLAAAPMFNIIDIPGVSTATNYVQQCVGSLNVNVPVFNPSVPAPVIAEVDDIEVREEKPIKIEDDEMKPHVSDDDDECDSDIVKLEFPGTDEAQEDDGHIVKFEVDENSNDNIETYYFFDDEVSAKKKKVESETTDSSFQIVNQEIDSERPVT